MDAVVVQIGRAVIDPDGWCGATARPATGAVLLVRPDQHIAERWPKTAVDAVPARPSAAVGS